MAQITEIDAWRRDIDHASPGGDPISFAQIKGTKGEDNLHGRKGADTIDGLGGDDLLTGRAGDDVLNGDRGRDVLKGSGGGDILNGDDGNDILFGGTERQEGPSGSTDQLDGGAGDDRIYGGAGADALTGGAGKDRFIYTVIVILQIIIPTPLPTSSGELISCYSATSFVAKLAYISSEMQSIRILPARSDPLLEKAKL